MKGRILFIMMLSMALTGSYMHKTNVTSGPKNSIPVFIKAPPDQTIKKGGIIKIEVTVTGTPTPDIRFYKDDSRLYADSRTTIKNDTTTGKSTLTISNAVSEDAGIYRVKAENIIGVADTTCKIKISPNK